MVRVVLLLIIVPVGIAPVRVLRPPFVLAVPVSAVVLAKARLALPTVPLSSIVPVA